MNRTTVPHRDKQSPLVSVIIPVYNAEQFVAQAIQSALAQTYRSYEIIVIDDGSTDKTKSALETFGDKIHCLYQENKGPSAARNAGMRIARGKYICFLDADDLWTPEKLEVQVSFMEKNDDIALVFSDHEDFNEDGIILSSFLGEKQKTFGLFPIKVGPIGNAFGKLVLENFISTPTVMFRKFCLEKVGLFDEEIRSVEDRDLWLRISAMFTIACIPKIFCKRRVHKTNISTLREISLRGKIRVLEKNWKLFPHLVPEPVWQKELADCYLSFGFILLQKERKWDAFQAGVKNLSYVWESINGCWSIRFWPVIFKSIGLLCATLLGWKVSRFLWKPIDKTFVFLCRIPRLSLLINKFHLS